MNKETKTAKEETSKFGKVILIIGIIVISWGFGFMSSYVLGYLK